MVQQIPPHPPVVVSMAKGGPIRSTKGKLYKLHKGERVLSVKQNKEYDKMKKTMRGIKGRRSTKGSVSITKPGRLNYTTKKGSVAFDRNGKRIYKKRKPFTE
jgi:hypothetical protein|tara:strand:+ start:632 stop:937 length:306 start_codon:yes stop_codon:yes gene_type:complete